MKRRTRQNIGNGEWPNMRADTLTAISSELIRARKKHPQLGDHVRFLKSYAAELESVLARHTANNGHASQGSAAQVYACAASVAAMAIRVLEEGSAGFRYSGNSHAPDFALTTVDNDRAD